MGMLLSPGSKHHSPQQPRPREWCYVRRRVFRLNAEASDQTVQFNVNEGWWIRVELAYFSVEASSLGNGAALLRSRLMLS